jgi:DNA-directed RNA polymerase subunit L
MKLKIIELEKDKIRIVLEGEGHTMVNALTNEILADPEVDVAKYVIKYQFSDPELLVTMKPGSTKEPLLVIREATQHLIDRCDDLLTCLKN